MKWGQWGAIDRGLSDSRGLGEDVHQGTSAKLSLVFVLLRNVYALSKEPMRLSLNKKTFLFGLPTQAAPS